MLREFSKFTLADRSSVAASMQDDGIANLSDWQTFHPTLPELATLAEGVSLADRRKSIPRRVFLQLIQLARRSLG